jgi:hypothetical protein
MTTGTNMPPRPPSYDKKVGHVLQGGYVGLKIPHRTAISVPRSPRTSQPKKPLQPEGNGF